MTGDDAPDRDDKTLRGQLAMDATDNLTISARWEKSKFKQTQTSSQLSIIDPFTASSAATSALNAALVATASGGNGIEKYDDERAVINDGGVLLGQVVPGFAGLPGFPDLEEGSDNDSDLGILTLDWAIGDHTLTAITGYAHYDYRDICDCDFAAIPLIQADAREDYDQWSQEIRLTSPGGEKVDYIAGLYYHQSDLEFRSIEAFGTALLAPEPGNPAVPNLTRDYSMEQDQDMWAIFGSLTYNWTDYTRVTFGLRFFEESKKVKHKLDKKFTAGWDYSGIAGLPPGTLAYGDKAAEYDRFENELGGGPLGILVDTANGIYLRNLGTSEHDINGRKRDEDEWTWALTLQHDLSDGTMLFATASTGTKGGGFDARFLGANNGPFFEHEEETAMNYEIGSKSTPLDGAMTLNATLFFNTVKDYQVSVFDGATAFFVQNAAEVGSKGVEVDLNWAATDNLVVSAVVSYLDAAYSDFPNAPCWAGTEDNNRGDCVGRGTPTAYRDASGDSNVFSPEWAFNLNVDYRQPIGDSLEARAILNINYSDEYANGSDLDKVYAYQDSFTKYDMRLSLGSYDGTWDVALMGKNLTDELTSGNNNDQPLAPGNGFSLTDRLRSYAVQATYRF